MACVVRACAEAVLLVYRRHMLQVGDSHEGLVEVVQLQDTGEQEEAGDQNTGEELGQSERLQTDGRQPAGRQGRTSIISV